jgi:phosphoribosylamine--glycine ligase
VLNVVALGPDFAEARGLAYQAVEMIGFEGMHYRTDIGHRAMR